MKSTNQSVDQQNKLKAAFPILCALAFLITCAKTSREDLLSGNFGTVDATPPQIISPKSESKITPDANGQMKATLTWGSKVGALRYTLEIALDSNFSQHIAGSPIEIKGQDETPPEKFFVFTAPDSLTYYWRVRANITEEGKYSETASLKPAKHA